MLRTRVDLPLPMPPSTTTLCSRIALAPAQVPPQAGEQAVVGAGSTCRQRYRRRCLQLRIAAQVGGMDEDRKSTRLNSSHSQISYAVFCLKKKKTTNIRQHKSNNC